jgi:hypothetical protein
MAFKAGTVAALGERRLLLRVGAGFAAAAGIGGTLVFSIPT